MKNSYVGFLSLIFLVGCGSGGSGSDSTDSITEQEEKNVVRITGDGISEEILSGTDNIDFELTSSANNSSYIINYNDKKMSNKLFGVIGLYPQSNSVSFMDYNTNKNQTTGCVKDLAVVHCSKNTSYATTTSNGKNKIVVDFKNELAEMYIESTSTSNTNNNRVPVVIDGRFSITAPQNWPIFQTKRFPIYQLDSKIFIDGNEFDVISVERPRFEYEHPYQVGQVTRQSVVINLKRESDLLNLVVTKRFDLPETAQNTFLHIQNDEYENSPIALANESWQDDGHVIDLNLSNVQVTDHNVQKSLNANIKILRSYAKLTLNGEAIDEIQVGSQFSTHVKNDRKIFSVYMNRAKNIAGLDVIQELNGHVSLQYSFLSDKFTCGDRTNKCQGVTYDEQAKNFTFNNVKIGNETLNGTIYFAGVRRF